MKYLKSILLFIKGFIMGSADIVPGVSGGTMALITGIYFQLIHSIKELNVTFILDYLRKDKRMMKKNFSRINFKFLIPLVLGIGSAFLLLSSLITGLIENYPANTYSFFFGLIIVSAFFLLKKINKFEAIQIFSFFVGFLASYLIAGMRSVDSAGHSYPIIFFSGMIAICAMILPGISGAFLLLLMGQYKYMLNAIHQFEIFNIIIFLLGAGIGLVAFSHILNSLLEKHKGLTLSFLVGIMLGALKLPYSEIIINPMNINQVIFFGILGIILVATIEFLYSRKIEKKI